MALLFSTMLFYKYQRNILFRNKENTYQDINVFIECFYHFQPNKESANQTPRLINLFHEISTAHKTKVPTNKEVSCLKSLRGCFYHVYKR